MTISNEVLAERIEGFTRQTVAESQQVRRDLTAATEQMGRVQDAVTAIADRQSHHEQLDGHRVSTLQLLNLTKDIEKVKEETEALRELTLIKTDVLQLKTEVAGVKAIQAAQKSFRDGQRSALSAGEKIVLILIAASGPMFAIIDKL